MALGNMSKTVLSRSIVEMWLVALALVVGLGLCSRSVLADSSHELLQTNVRALIEDLGDQDPYKRRVAAEALGEFGRSASIAVGPLDRPLNDKMPNVRASAADALGRIGADANVAVPALILSLSDPDPSVRLTVTAVSYTHLTLPTSDLV